MEAVWKLLGNKKDTSGYGGFLLGKKKGIHPPFSSEKKYPVSTGILFFLVDSIRFPPVSIGIHICVHWSSLGPVQWDLLACTGSLGDPWYVRFDGSCRTLFAASMPTVHSSHLFVPFSPALGLSRPSLARSFVLFGV